MAIRVQVCRHGVCSHLDLFLRLLLLGSEDVASSRKITSAALDFDMVDPVLCEQRVGEGCVERGYGGKSTRAARESEKESVEREMD